MRRLFWDIETAPGLYLSWRCGYKINISYENIVSERKMICIAYKWEGEKKVHSLQWDKNQDDRKMLQSFIPVLDSADESVAHFGDGFDLPWVRTRCLYHKIPTLPDYKTIDTLKWARSKYNFQSNKLDYIARFLGLGHKLRTGDGLWRRIFLNKDKKSLDFMVKYNCWDVELLEKVYNRLTLNFTPKTHAGVLSEGHRWSCPRCTSTKVKSNKRRVTAAGAIKWQMQCNEKGCGGYYTVSDSVHESYLCWKPE